MIIFVWSPKTQLILSFFNNILGITACYSITTTCKNVTKSSHSCDQIQTIKSYDALRNIICILLSQATRITPKFNNTQHSRGASIACELCQRGKVRGLGVRPGQLTPMQPLTFAIQAIVRNVLLTNKKSFSKIPVYTTNK